MPSGHGLGIDTIMETITLLANTQYTLVFVLGSWPTEIKFKLEEVQEDALPIQIIYRDYSTSTTFPFDFTTTAGTSSQQQLCGNTGQPETYMIFSKQELSIIPKGNTLNITLSMTQGGGTKLWALRYFLYSTKYCPDKCLSCDDEFSCTTCKNKKKLF